MIAWLLDTEERKRITENAIQRNTSKDPSASRRAGNQFSDSELDVIGAWGEAAAAAFCGGTYDDVIRLGGDGGVDFHAAGRSYACKYNHRRGGYLMVEERTGDTRGGLHDIESVEVIVSTAGLCDPPRVCFCRKWMESTSLVPVVLQGWLYPDEFLEKMTYNDWGLGGRWCVPAHRLHDIRTVPALRREA